MKGFLFPLILIGVISISGCIGQQLENVTYGQENIPEKLPTDARKINLNPLDYTLEPITVDIPHKMIYEKVRWNSSTVTFYSKIKENSTLQTIRDGIDTWNKEATDLIKFVEVDDAQKANFIIRYATSGEYEEKKTAAITVTLGEALLTTYDVGLFNLTASAEMLYTPTANECENKITVIHELGHILGFAHTSDVKSVMFPTVDCSAKITDQMRQTLKNIYSIEALPDLYFGVIEAEKIGKNVAINFTIWNRGLIKSESVSVDVKADEIMVESYDIPFIEPGAGWMIQDVIFTEKDFTNLSLDIDPSHVQKELDIKNNIIVLKAYS